MDPEIIVNALVGWLGPGALQGLAEVFPVSSSAHVVLFGAFSTLLGGPSAPTFAGTIFLHLSILVAVLPSYGTDIRSTASAWLRALARAFHLSNQPVPAEWKIVPGLALATLVTGVEALVLKGGAEYLFGQPVPVAVLLIVNGIVLCLTGRFKGGFRQLSEFGLWDYVFVGFWQGLAVVPGISRLGMVLCAGLWRKLAWFEALKLSFLVTLPVILGVNAAEIVRGVWMGQNIGWPQSGPELGELLAGIALASLFSFGAIRILRQGGMYAYRKLNYFGIYCVALGLFAIVYLFSLG